MIHFVVVSGAAPSVDRLSGRLSPSLERTRLFDGERLQRVGASRAWAAAALALPDPSAATRFAADDDAVIVVNGPVLAGGDHRGLAESALRTFRGGGSAAVSGMLGGAYNFVGVAPSTGLRAFTDFSGLFPLYWYEGPDYAVVSNRSTTVATVIGSRGWDSRALGWVIGHANLFDDRMPARGVTYVPPGMELHVESGSGRARVGAAPTWIWPESSEDRGRENLDPGQWDDVVEALLTNFRGLPAFGGTLRLAITGGKDSRLCLALAKAAGLEDRIETFTGGTAESPEVEVGAEVARAAGFRHRRVGPAATGDAGESRAVAATRFDPSAQWRRLQEDAYRYESIVPAWSGLGNPSHPPVLNIKGFGGEFYRRGNAKQFRGVETIDLDRLAAMFVNYHQIHDPLNVLRRDEADYQSEWLKEWVYTTARDVRLDLLPEKFYVDYRLGHWSGPLLQATPERITVNPLLSSTAARMNVALSASARNDERFHFEVMRRAAPELVAIPFLNDTWAPALAAASPIELPRDPYPTVVTPTTRVLTQTRPAWRFLEGESKPIERLFKDANRRTDMRAICDMRVLRRVAAASAGLQKSAEVKELFSAIGVALTLLDRAEPVLDHPTSS